MRPADLLRTAWIGVTRRPLRSALTAATLTLGVVSLTVVQGAGELVRESAVDSALLRGGPSVTVTVALSDSEPEHSRRLTELVRSRLGTNGTVALAERLPSVALSDTAVPDTSDRKLEAFIVDESLTSILPFRIIDGRWHRPGTLVPDVVANVAAARMTSGGDRRWLSWSSSNASVLSRVVGVVEDGHDEPRLYLNTEDRGLLAHLGLQPDASSVMVLGRHLDELAIRTLVADAASALALTPMLGEAVRTDEMASYDDQLAMVRSTFLLLAVISLIVAVVGLLNIGLASLNERMQELSLRLALGATGRELALLMLVESQVIAVGATCVAIPTAYVVLPVVLDSLGAPVTVASVPGGALLVGLSAGAGAALLGAVIPSIKASRAPVAGALR
jgi:putative ABC transport system permease protein